MSVLARESELRREADALLWQRGLHKLLAEFGEPRVDGSYALKLMTWRDLDIYLVCEDLAVSTFFELGGRVAELLLPHKMSHRNERVARTPGLPQGLYWGIYLGNERKDAWKIDVWAVDRPEYERLSRVRSGIADRLTDESRVRILEIKEKCWRDPRYRKEYSSMDIYRAVLEDGVVSIAQFSSWLMDCKGLSLSLSSMGEA